MGRRGDSLTPRHGPVTSCVCVCVVPASWPIRAPIGLASHLRPKWILNSNPHFFTHTHTHTHRVNWPHLALTSISAFIKLHTILTNHLHLSFLVPRRVHMASASDNHTHVVARMQTHFTYRLGTYFFFLNLCHSSCWAHSSHWHRAPKTNVICLALAAHKCQTSSANNRSKSKAGSRHSV